MDPATKRLTIFATVIGTALLGLVAVWAFTGHHHGGVPVVEAPSGPLKIKPSNPGGMQVDGANDAILSGETAGKETVAPGPEAPAPQALKAQEQAAATQAAESPAPAAAVAPPGGTADATATAATADAGAPAAAAESHPLPPLRPHVSARAGAVASTPAPAGSTASDGTASVRLIPGAKPGGLLASVEPGAPRAAARTPTQLTPPPATAAPAATASAQAPARLAAAQPAQAPLVAATPGPVRTAKARPLPSAAAASALGVAPAPEAATKGHHAAIQLAAVASSEAALAEWQRLAKRYPDLLGGRKPAISKTEHDGKTFYRVRTGGFVDSAQASAMCQQVRARGGACTVASF